MKVNPVFLVIVFLAIIFYCVCTSYKQRKLEEVAFVSTKPRDMDIVELQRETDIMGFGMGPGLVDTRRHHVIA